MAVVSCTERITERTGSENAKGEAQYVRVFEVLTDDNADGPLTARAYVKANKVAAKATYSTSSESDTGVYASDYSETCVAEDGLTWHVQVSYSPIPDNPTTQDPEVSWSFAQYQRPIDVTPDGDAIVNSAGDPPSDQQVADDSRPLLTIVNNQSSYSAGWSWLYKDSVNADTFMGLDKNTVKIQDISAKRLKDDYWGYYWQVTFSMSVNPDSFSLVLLDQGFREKDANGVLQQIKVKNVPVTEPHLLDGKGKALGKNKPEVFRSFDIYPKLPFSTFGLE